MILESLTLREVGVYAGEQRIEFAEPSRDRPVTLVGGLNGAGKTTLMRSLFHVLYGAHALPLIERRGSYDRYLQDVTRAGASAAGLELDFVVQRNASNERITIRRSWQRRRDRWVESVEAFRDGSYDEALSEGWLDFIESVVPRGIARLVFFDGEKVEALADLSNASETLRTAVGALLGLDLVDQLVVDLEVVERRRATAAATSDERDRMEALDRGVAEAEAVCKERERELEAVREDVQVAAGQFASAEDAYRSAGGDVFERRAAVLKEVEAAREALRAAEANARTLAVHELAPLLLIPRTLAQLASRATREQELDELRVAHRVIVDRDRLFASMLHEVDLDQQVREALIRRLREDRERLASALNEASADLGVAHLAPGLDELLSSGLDGLESQRKAAISAIDDARARVDQTDRLAAQVPTEEAMRELEQARAEAVHRLEGLRKQEQWCEKRRDEARRQLERAKAARERFARELAAERLRQMDSERVVKHAQRARETLTRLRERAAARHLGRIAELAVESLEQLLRKDRLIAAITIDVTTYTPSFRDRNGRVVHPEQLSAGERQLTALALLWALARASGRPLPVLIDTPLGRLDAGHRRHVVRRYLPVASQQVVVLSTDTEIEDALLADLEPHIGRSYALVFDSAEDATTIEPGYLELELAA